MQWTQTRLLAVRSRQWLSVHTEICGFPLPSLTRNFRNFSGNIPKCYFFGKLTTLFLTVGCCRPSLLELFPVLSVRSYRAPGPTAADPLRLLCSQRVRTHQESTTSRWHNRQSVRCFAVTATDWCVGSRMEGVSADSDSRLMRIWLRCVEKTK